MLTLNIQRAFAMRGINNPSSYLFKMGMSRATISRMLRGDKSNVSYYHLESICALLNCTPNDLFEYRPDKDSKLPENHSLNTLRRDNSARSIREITNDIPMEKLSELKNLLK